MSATRQGSSSFTIVLGALAALIVGALILTFLVYPIFNSFTTAAFWSADTAGGARMLMIIEGLWRFWGGIVLIALVTFIWVRTRQ